MNTERMNSDLRLYCEGRSYQQRLLRFRASSIADHHHIGARGVSPSGARP